jgi:NADH dehydrogenase
MQMGAHVAKEIACDLKGQPRTKFEYFDRGDMATIGRKHAVANVKWPFRAHLGGFLAWLSWLFIHLLFLIGLRNRLIVLVEWTWSYLLRERGVRLITDETKNQNGTQ